MSEKPAGQGPAATRNARVAVALGIAIGAAIGAALNNIPVGVGLGAGVGAVVALLARRRRPGGADENP